MGAYLETTPLPETGVDPDTRSWGEAFGDYAGLAFEAQRLNDNPTNRHEALSEAYDRRIAAVAAATGVTLDHPYRHQASELVSDDPLVPRRTPRLEQIAAGEKLFAQRLRELALQHPGQVAAIRPDVPVLDDAMRAAVGANTALDREAGATRLGGVGRFTADFAGRAGAWLRDPLNVATLLVGGPEATGAKTVGARILQRMATEATVNAGLELGLQAAAEDWRKQTGQPLGWDGLWTQVGLAAVFGGGTGGLVQGGSEVLSRLGRADPGTVAAFERVARGDGTPDDLKAVGEALAAPASDVEAKAYAAALDADADAAAALGDVSPRDAGQALTAIETGEVALPRAAAAQPPAGVALRGFRPNDLLVDPGRFQFKAGGDAEGVTGALRGVREWIPERADPLMVFEDTDGRVFVVDGHQRSGLARRLEAEGHDPITLNAYVFRAADGYSDADIRVRAALKNIGQGSGSAIDAAKVLRTGKLSVADTGLPPGSAMVRDAAGLARLSDDAFVMAVNEVVDPKIAAVVGRLADDPALHAQMLDVLKEAEPRGIAEAESMVRDLMAEPTFTERQDSLFGEQDFARMLLKEKAQVRQAALRSIGKDRAVFNRLVQEQSRIAKAGNVLDTAANLERAQTDAVLLTAIDRLSRRTGPVADALNAAARAVAGGERPAAAARGFADAVRSAIAEGGLGRAMDDGAAAPLVDPTVSGPHAIEPGTPDAGEAAEAALAAAGGPPPRADEASADLFGSEATPAGQQILIPGVAEITVKDITAAAAARPMQGGSAPPPAGGLFDLEARKQIDLMDAIPAGRDADGNALLTTHAELVNEADRTGYLADVIASCRD